MFTSHCARAAYSCLFALAATAPVFGDEVLFTNGPIITNPTGGTGAIAGLPISNADPYTVPGQPGSFVTTRRWRAGPRWRTTSSCPKGRRGT